MTMQSVNACHREVYSKELTVVPGKREVALWDSCHNKIGCYKSDWDFRKRSYGFLEDGYMCTWDFGDGARESNPADKVTHVYDHPGTYVVVATVEDRCESRVVKDTVKVVGNDSLDFELAKTVACVGDTVEVRFVQRGEEVFTGLTWTLPGNLFETIRNEDVVKYVCRNAGSKQIKLSAMAASGCPEETISKSLRIAETPDVRILGMNAARPDSAECVPFDLQPRAMDWNDCQATVRWDFGNGDLSGDRYPKTTYREPGKYTVRLTMTTPEGCTDTDTLPVVAKKTPLPVLALKDSLVCSTSGDFELTAYNRTEDIEENSYRWKSQSEERYERDSVTFSFKGFWGSEEILLRAQNRETMCTSTAQVTFVMSKALKASLEVSPDTVCAGMEVVFRDTLSLAGATREFYFDDGTLDDSREVCKTYWERGKYAYRFVQRNADGCTDTLRDEIFVHTLPVAEFEWRETILEPNIENLRPGIELPEKGNGGVRFTNHSTLDPMEGEGSGLYYYWDFGDGQSAREKEPAHRFENNGVYDVVLHAVTELGCRDSISHLVDDIAAIKGLFFPNAVVPASSDPGVNRFQPKGIGLHTFTLKLYGPDGTCVWQTNKLDDGRPAEYWDGTYNGQPVPAGVYNWEASALFIDGTVQNHINGALIVIR
ncbi:MAG: PKD domain-containing protein [Odoribacter sp.]|nr:PKD domain-containing protein [Odoribacter sp.]